MAPNSTTKPPIVISNRLTEVIDWNFDFRHARWPFKDVLQYSDTSSFPLFCSAIKTCYSQFGRIANLHLPIESKEKH